MTQRALCLAWSLVLLWMSPASALENPEYQRLKSELQGLEEEIAYWSAMVENPDIVYLMTMSGPAVPMSRAQYGGWLLERRLQSGWTDRQIAEHQVHTERFSAAHREQLKKDFLPRLTDDAAGIRSRMAALAPPGDGTLPDAGNPVMPFDQFAADNLIGGDWILSLDGHDNIIYVSLDEKRRLFVGTLSVNHYLEFHRQGDVLFELAPVKDTPNRFQGTEFGFDDQGVAVQAPVTVEIRDRTMLYQSPHQTLRLVRR